MLFSTSFSFLFLWEWWLHKCLKKCKISWLFSLHRFCLCLFAWCFNLIDFIDRNIYCFFHFLLGCFEIEKLIESNSLFLFNLLWFVDWNLNLWNLFLLRSFQVKFLQKLFFLYISYFLRRRWLNNLKAVIFLAIWINLLKVYFFFDGFSSLSLNPIVFIGQKFLLITWAVGKRIILRNAQSFVLSTMLVKML